MSEIICIMISIATAWALIKPFYSEHSGVNQFTEKTDLMLLKDQKSRSVNMLRDLELDYSTGKLSKEEYETIKTELSLELSEILNKIDSANK